MSWLANVGTNKWLIAALVYGVPVLLMIVALCVSAARRDRALRRSETAR